MLDCDHHQRQRRTAQRARRSARRIVLPAAAPSVELAALTARNLPISQVSGMKLYISSGSTMSITHAIGYLRTSSATNVGEDKDSEPRQRATILAGAKRLGLE